MLEANPFPDFIHLATRITQKIAYDTFSAYMNNIQTLKHIFLNECIKSNEVIFAACQILGKKILKGEILKSAQDMDVVDSANSENIKNSLFLIATKLYDIINSQIRHSLQPFIVRSILNSITLCMFAIIRSSTTFSPTFINFLIMLAPDFAFNQKFISPTNDNSLNLIQPSKEPLQYYHNYVNHILMSLVDYFVNSTYFINYYTFRRSLYLFRNCYLAYLLNYSVFALKTKYQSINQLSDYDTAIVQMKPFIQTIEHLVMFPFSLTMHEYETEDDMHQNISGLQSEIYFPSYFRNVLCDTSFLLDLINIYSYLNQNFRSRVDVMETSSREETYMMIRIIGRLLSSSEYIFMGEGQKKGFRSISLIFMTRMLKQTSRPDSYLIMCLTKINLKFMSIQNEQQLFEGKREYFQNLVQFICTSLRTCKGKIEDGDKHPFRQLFQLLTGFVNISANTDMDEESKMYAQEVLEILLKQRLCDNVGNAQTMIEFGSNNSQQVDCFREIFSRVAQIFKINLSINLKTLNELNFSALNSASLIFWLHLMSHLLPEHDTSTEQIQLIIKFLNAAIQARSIASLHYIQTVVKQVLFELKDGISTTALWKFISQQKQIRFQEFLIEIIKYAMHILTVPNQVLIQNCLQLFKTMFSQLCKFKHKSFTRYFQIIEQVCIDINQTMLVRPQYSHLRIGFFSIISIIWINEGQINLVYKVFTGIRQSVSNQPDIVGFLRYMTDMTGLLQPVETSEIYKILIELVVKDMATLLPYFFDDPQKLKRAFGDEGFLKVFIRFVMTIVTDSSYRLSEDVHTQLPFKIDEIFRPYLIQSIKYDYPTKLVQTWLKFLKLNPLSPLLPLQINFKLKCPQYKTLLRQYFDNLHRLSSLEEFYQIYQYIDDNIQLMMDWWEQIMARGLKPNINVGVVAKSHIWSNNRQKQMMGRLVHRIGKYEAGYWPIHDLSMSESMYSEWFVVNFE